METLSIQMQPFFEWLLRITLQASLLICLILSLQTFLRSRLGVRWHYGLWLVLLLRMAMPWMPESRVSVFNLLPQSIPQRQFEHAIVPVGDVSADSIVVSADTSESTPISDRTVAQKKPEPVTITPQPTKEAQGPAKSTFPKFVAMFPLVWLTGALVLAAYICASNFYLWWLVTRERPLTDQKILDLLEDCKSQMGIRTILGVVTTDKVKSPALFGFVRPRLLLPDGMIEALSKQELRYVFLHELAHLKRHDIYIGWLASLLQILHWFNPLVWLAFYRMRSDRELACDALVLARTQSDEPKSYGRIIVNLVERFSRPQRLPGMAGILETKSQLKRRLTMITKFKKNSYQWSPLAVILIVLLACISLPDAKHTKASGIALKEPIQSITLRRIWSYSYPVTDGEPSPDGRYLSYTDWETGDLAVCEIATGTKRRLTNKGTWDESDESAYSSRWSPDGGEIVYGWEMGRDSVELRIISTDGSGHRILYRTDEQHRWAEPCDWFPDGKDILASLTTKDGTDKIVRISTEDGTLQVLKTVGKDCLHQATLSPDGQYIAYAFNPEDDDNSLNLDISLISSDATREVSLVKHASSDLVLGWAPDGKSILFASDRTGAWGMWLIAVADGKPQGAPELLKQVAGQFRPMGFTREGSYYYSTSRASDDVYVATIDPENGKVIAPPKKAVERYEGSNIAAAYSPDGNYVAYIHRLGFAPPNRSRSNVLCIRSLETGKEREYSLNLSNIIRYSSLRWSPDGHSILVTGYNDKDSFGIYSIDVQTWAVKYLVRSNACEWSGDGKAVIYRSGAPEVKVGQIVMRNLESGNEEVLHRSPSGESIFNIALSPDGQSLALRCIRPTSLKIISLARGQVRELPEFEKVASAHKPIAWTVDSKYILFSGNEAGGGNHPLCRISVDSGQVEKLGMERNQYSTLSVHPDGRHILISGSESAPASEVWVMENFLPEAPVAKAEQTTTLRKVSYPWGGYATLSPDGRYMCDVDWDVDWETETEKLVLRELATGRERFLTTTGHPEYSAISPTGTQVAYLWYDVNWTSPNLCTVRLDGSDRRCLRRDDLLVPQDWSEDGTKILAIQSVENLKYMVWVSAADGSIHRIKSVGKGRIGKFDISPDGRFIAYDGPQAEDTSKRDVFVFDLNQNRELSFVNHPADDRLLGWSPDGRYIFFASDRTGAWDAWLQRIEEGQPQGFPELARQSIGDVTPIGFTHSGSFYYLTGGKPMYDVFSATLDLDSGEVLDPPMPVYQSGATTCQDWSPDGQYLVYCVRRPDESQMIQIRTLSTGRERRLVDHLRNCHFLRWSLDGQSILLTLSGQNLQGVICKIDIETGERTELLQSMAERLRQCALSPDGKTLFYLCHNPNAKTTRFVARDLGSSLERDLTKVEHPIQIPGFNLSPDGQRLAYITRRGASWPSFPALKIIPATGGEPIELVTFGDSEKMWLMALAWMPDSQDVLFVKWLMEGKGGELWRISAQGGQPRKLWVWKEGFGMLRVHPDGRRIAFRTRSVMTDMWVMENFLPTTIASAAK